MFEGFSLEQIKLPEATLRVRVGGRGHRFLMLHFLAPMPLGIAWRRFWLRNTP
ncbi:hypothetical protein NKI41_27940 [Mesorhizobium sp. M0601]|uniref:hypothetical protein n=1 Tax=unclassified Mesorhizobium TaxID=325217 RepID=UPI0033351F2D